MSWLYVFEVPASTEPTINRNMETRNSCFAGEQHRPPRCHGYHDELGNRVSCVNPRDGEQILSLAAHHARHGDIHHRCIHHREKGAYHDGPSNQPLPEVRIRRWRGGGLFGCRNSAWHGRADVMATTSFSML